MDEIIDLGEVSLPSERPSKKSESKKEKEEKEKKKDSPYVPVIIIPSI